MITISRHLIKQNAQAYNKHLTDEICEGMSNSELFARCHPVFRQDNAHEMVKSELT